MASITIRGLGENTKDRLRRRAARHGRSMEAEARQILTDAMHRSDAGGGNLAESIRSRLSVIGGFELKPTPRGPMREPPDFSTPEYDG